MNKRLLSLLLLVLVVMMPVNLWAQDEGGTTLKSNVYVGGDISMLPKYEEAEVEYKDSLGNTVNDVIAFFKQEGLNAMRVRLFVDPTKATDNEQKQGVCQDLNYVIALGKRIKDAGLSFLLDFHYSDTWADPGRQWTPDAWKTLDDDALAIQLYTYTKECLQQLKNAGAIPDMIQTGNEISYGMLWGVSGTTDNRCYTNSDNANWLRFFNLLGQTTKACREECPNAKIILHNERVNNISTLTDFYDRMQSANIDYDIIGLSYYPEFHGNLATLEEAISALEAKNYGKSIMLVETGYSYAWSITDGVKYDYTSTYPFTEEGQRQFTADLITMLNQHSSITGLFWWWPEDNGNKMVTSYWWNAGLYNHETGQPYAAFYELKNFVGNSPGFEPYAVLTTDTTSVLSSDSTGVTYGQTLTFYYDDKKTERNGMSVGPFTETYDSGQERWNIDSGWDEKRENITTVVFDDSFANCTTLTSTAYWFYECNKLTAISSIEYLKTDNVTNMNHMFSGCSGLTNLDVSNFKTDNVTNMGYLFSGCSSLTSLDVSGFNTSKVTNMYYLFSGCSGLTSLDVSNFNTVNVADMGYMFQGCSGLTSLDVSNFKTDNVNNMGYMFSNCSGLTSLDVSGFNTANVIFMHSLFSGCSNLTSLDVSNFKTDNVTRMSFMFSQCSGLTSLDVSSFNTKNVTNMGAMFQYCSSLTNLDVSGFNTANVTYMNQMFTRCSSLSSLDLSSFNTANVTAMANMFYRCYSLTTIYAGSGWNTANISENSSGSMFKDCTNLVGGAGTVYDANHIDYTYAHIDGGENNPGYLTSIADTAAVAPVTFACENNELTLLCETPNTTIWYAVNQNVTDTLDVKSVTIAEFNAAEVSNDVWYRLTGTVHNLKDGDQYGNFNLQDETDSVYVYGLLSEKGGEKKKFQELVAEKGITNGSTITIIGHRGEYNGKVEVVNAYYDNGEGDWQQYTAPLALDSDCTVKAYAARPSGIRSAISSYVFKKTERPKVETPTFAWENDKLLISSATEDATIYYSVKEFTTEPTGDGTLASPYNVAAALQYINTLEGDSPSSDSIFVKGVVSDIKDVSPQYGNATFYITDIGKTGGNYLYAYRVKDVGNQNISSEDAVKLGDEVIIRGLVVKYRGVTPETVQGAAYIYAYTTPEMNMLYESPIAVSDNVIVRAKATKQDMSDSEMAMLSVSSEPYALLSENNTKLTFYYDKLKDAKGGMGVGPFIQSYNTETGSYYLQGREWEDHAGDITTVEFDPSFGNCTTITNMVGWFFENTKLQTINGLEYLNTSNVTNMLALFNGCTSLTSLDLSTFDTHNVTNMRGMFYGCTSLTTLNVSSFNTSNVLGFNSMFNNCTSLKSIDVSRFDTKNATSLRMMFLNCHSLESLDITNFETSNVTDMYYVFGGLQLPSIDLSKMNTEKVETMEGLFSHTAFTSLDLSSFNTSQVKNMYSMFANSSNLQTIYVGDGWSTESIVITDSTSYGSRLFYGCEKLVGGKGTVYDASHIDVTYAHIDGGTSNPGYFTDKNAPVIEATFDGRVLAVGGSTTMTDALESVGGRDEVAKTITAIVWNSTVALTNSDLQGLDNPNLLIYVNERSQAPENRNNVVVNGLAMNVVLSDTGSGNCDFYAPQTFTAEMITYSREFKQATQVGVCRGWETISLPFMVQTIAHADNGVITPFGVDTSNKHFWLRQLSTNGLVSATKIEANVPYLISMPNDEKNYAKEYILKGLVTFSAENAVVPKTEPTALALADSSVVMVPALQSVGKSSTVWALNVGQERSQYFEGSTFERDYREVHPFEAYTVHRSDTPAPRFLPINDLMNSATGIETISNVIMTHDNYYRLDGRKVDGKPTKKGLYITNGRKIVIK